MCGRDHMSIVCCFTYSEFVTVSTRDIKPVLNRTHRPSPQIYNRNIIYLITIIVHIIIT